MDITDALNRLINYPRQVQGKLLLNQIIRLHPELGAYQGKAKIKVYTLLTHKLPTNHHDFIGGQKPEFNFEADQADPQLRYRALDFINRNHSLVYHFVAKWLTSTSEVDSLEKCISQLEALIITQNEVIAAANQVVTTTSQAIRNINKAARPDSRLN